MHQEFTMVYTGALKTLLYSLGYCQVVLGKISCEDMWQYTKVYKSCFRRTVFPIANSSSLWEILYKIVEILC